MRKSVALAFWISAGLLVTGSTAAYAQGSITGAVKDSSGAFLPGVTVEAASPVLIERVRSVVTDGTGQYKIEQLRPGLYSVTFSLTGFSTVKREGIELTGSFVATVNAELKVGSVQETITVTGESPVVDVQTVTQQRVLTKDVIDAIPTGRSQFNLAALIPGMNTTQDVGGASNLILGSVSLHGGRATDTRTQIDGLPSGNMEQGGQLSNFIPDMGAVQEVAIDYAAASAEVTYDGPRVNLIPKEGGNNIKVSFYGTDVNSSFQGSNYTQDLQDRGLRTPNSIKRNYEYNPGGGGPLVKDKLWFYGSAGWRQNNNYVAGMYRNLNAGDPTRWTYVADLNNPADSKKKLWNANSRLTWQASQKHKFSVYYDNQGRVEDSISATVAPEAANQYTYPIQKLGSVSWSAPLTSRLLLDVRSSLRGENYVVGHPPPGDPFRTLIPVIEQGGPIAGLLYRGSGQQNSLPFFNVYGFNKTVFASLSYVTGSHSLKVGISDIFGGRNVSVNDNDYSLTYRFNNGVPNQLTEKTTPFRFQQRVRAELGAYVQDKWTVNHMTVNAGLRLDYLDTYHPEQALGPAPLVPTRNFTTPETQALHWTDLSPRLGVAYDLFGNGKTALKVSLNKFVLAQGLQGVYGDLSNPVRVLANIVTRSWTDANANFVADCDLLNPASQDRRTIGGDFCGAMSDQNFGKATATMAYDPRTLTGFGNRPDNWEFSAGVQHELLARVSLNASLFRRWYGNFALTDNRAVAPSDYSLFSITAPVDPRLPGSGGFQIGGLYDLNPNKVGVVDNYFTLASDYGNQIEHWNGIDISVNARPGRGVLLQGGVSSGRTSTDNCDIVAKVDNPSPLYCHVDTAFLTQIKLLGTYAIPKVDVNFGVTYQSIPGPAIAAIYNAPNALVAPSLGRNLSGGAANVAVNLVEPGVSYGERLNQLDLRFSKVLRYRKSRTLANLDLYNAFNANPVLTQNNNYATWQVPQSILLARFAKISVQFDF